MVAYISGTPGFNKLRNQQRTTWLAVCAEVYGWAVSSAAILCVPPFEQSRNASLSLKLKYFAVLC